MAQEFQTAPPTQALPPTPPPSNPFFQMVKNHKKAFIIGVVAVFFVFGGTGACVGGAV